LGIIFNIAALDPPGRGARILASAREGLYPLQLEPTAAERRSSVPLD